MCIRDSATTWPFPSGPGPCGAGCALRALAGAPLARPACPPRAPHLARLRRARAAGIGWPSRCSSLSPLSPPALVPALTAGTWLFRRPFSPPTSSGCGDVAPRARLPRRRGTAEGHAPPQVLNAREEAPLAYPYTPKGLPTHGRVPPEALGAATELPGRAGARRMAAVSPLDASLECRRPPKLWHGARTSPASSRRGRPPPASAAPGAARTAARRTPPDARPAGNRGPSGRRREADRLAGTRFRGTANFPPPSPPRFVPAHVVADSADEGGRKGRVCAEPVDNWAESVDYLWITLPLCSLCQVAPPQGLGAYKGVLPPSTAGWGRRRGIPVHYRGVDRSALRGAL